MGLGRLTEAFVSCPIISFLGDILTLEGNSGQVDCIWALDGSGPL